MVQIKYTLNLIVFIILLIRTIKVFGRDLSEQERALRAEFVQKLLNRQNKLDGKIKLLGGASKYEGNVYIYHAGRWGAVCDDSWDDEAAAVVCKSFNMTGVATVGGQYGQTIEKYWLDDVICQGDESSLSKCVFNRWGASDCGRDEAAGVMCMPESESPKKKSVHNSWPSRQLREVLNETNAYLRLIGGKNNNEGRVEVFHNNKWGSICPDGWTHYEASVVCRHLDLGYAEQALQTYAFGFSEIVISGINCEGNETSLFDCRHRQNNEVGCPGDFGINYNNFGECAQELHDLIPPAPFYHRTSRRTASYHPYLVAIPPIHTKRFQTSFIMRTANEWNLLTASVFPNAYNPNLFKVRVNRLLLGHAAAVVCTHLLADLVLDMAAIERSAHLQDVLMYQLQCAMEENCLSKSAYEVKELIPDWQYETRRLLRFTAASLNAGTAEFRPYLPKHLWQWHMCHMHYHSMEVFATFDVLDFNGLRVAEGHKASFCLEDNTCIEGVEKKYSCKNYGDQGISVNCSDVYKYNIDCQWVDVTDVQPGDYTFRVAVNPHARIAEQSFHNNAATCALRLTTTYATVYGCKHIRP